MQYHSVYLIFELLYLKYKVTGDSSIKIDYLKDAFYELEYNVNDLNNVNQELDFETELEQVLEDFSCIFETFDDEISFTAEDPDILYEIIPEFLDEKPTAIDYYIEDAINDDNIYQTLRLKPPLKEMQNIFEINKNILFLYNLIAKQEFEGKDPTPVCKLINFYESSLKELFKNLDNINYIKIKIWLAYYNDKYLTNEAKPNINSSWYLALLSKSKTALLALSYDKILYYIDNEKIIANEEKTESREINPEETAEEYLAETYYIHDELEYFLAHYILYLNDYINHMESSEIKRLLLQKKYLLLSTGELNDTEEYYLKNGTLDTLSLPPYIKKWLTTNNFDFLIGNFEEIKNNI